MVKATGRTVLTIASNAPAADDGVVADSCASDHVGGRVVVHGSQQLRIKRVGTADAVLVIGTGLSTCFFGFGAGALLSTYLRLTHSPEFLHLRTTLSFRSAILGDGVILPILDMIAVSTLLANRAYSIKQLRIIAVLVGVTITAYFHIQQAVDGLVNWAMPQPWHWNLLGLWHAVYMLTVATLLSLYFMLSIVIVHRERTIPWSLIISILCVIAFFVLLGTDYL